MGKKNLSALMDGLMGPSTEPAPSAKSVTPAERNEQPSIRPQKGKRGRPSREGAYTNSTYAIEDELLRKLKYVAFIEEINRKDIINDALRMYFEKWERENGRIPDSLR